MSSPHNKHQKIVKHTEKQLKSLLDKTDYQRLDNLPDEKIDYSDIPEKSQAFWSKAKVEDSGVKKAISLRVDNDVLNWFKDQKGRYQVLMNKVLRQYMDAHQH